MNPVLAFAASASTVATNAVADSATWALVGLSLLGIIALIFVLGWLARRMTSGRFSAQRQMKVISVLPLGARERVALIDVGGQQFLLGITTQSINYLHRFESPLVPDEAMPEGDFVMKLKGLMLRQQDAQATPGAATASAVDRPGSVSHPVTHSVKGSQDA